MWPFSKPSSFLSRLSLPTFSTLRWVAATKNGSRPTAMAGPGRMRHAYDPEPLARQPGPSRIVTTDAAVPPDPRHSNGRFTQTPAAAAGPVAEALDEEGLVDTAELVRNNLLAGNADAEIISWNTSAAGAPSEASPGSPFDADQVPFELGRTADMPDSPHASVASSEISYSSASGLNQVPLEFDRFGSPIDMPDSPHASVASSEVSFGSGWDPDQDLLEFDRCDSTLHVPGSPGGSVAPSATGTEAWLGLTQQTASLHTAPDAYLPPGAVENNGVAGGHRSLPCVAGTCVKVSLPGIAEPAPIHANKIDLGAAAGAVGNALEVAGKYVVGQAPKKLDAFEKLLVHAITSGEGIFQIVSPNVHRVSRLQDPFPAKAPHSIMPVIRQLEDYCRAQNPGLLAGRYEIRNRHLKSPAPGQDQDRLSCIVEVYDTIDQRTISIPLTQIGLPFDEALLKADAIVKAAACFEAHLKNRPHQVSQDGPVVISAVGVGRNAAVVVYREMMARMKDIPDLKALDMVLREVILRGRQGRGPNFIHSKLQFKELRTLLREKFSQIKQGETRRPAPAPTPPACAGASNSRSDAEEIAVAAAGNTASLPETPAYIRNRIVDVAVAARLETRFNATASNAAVQAVNREFNRQMAAFLPPGVSLAPDIPRSDCAATELASNSFAPTVNMSAIGNAFIENEHQRLGAFNNDPRWIKWMRDNHLVSIPNPGTSNNCLLYSLLQHATGRYDPAALESHARVAQALKQAMVEMGFPGVTVGDQLLPGCRAVSWAIREINQLYGRRLRLMTFRPGLDTTADATEIVPFVDYDQGETAGDEPILVWAQGCHFVAVIRAGSR